MWGCKKMAGLTSFTIPHMVWIGKQMYRLVNYLGINRHVAMHRDKRQRCKVTYTYGDTYTYPFDELKKRNNQPTINENNRGENDGKE